MRTSVPILVLAALLACSPGDDTSGDSNALECVEQTILVSFTDDAPPYAEVHRAVTSLSGEFEHQATWHEESTPTTVTTTVDVTGDSYELTVVDQGAACSIAIGVPVRVSIQTDDGYLLLERQATWGRRFLIQPFTTFEEIEIGARLTTAPDGSSWLTFPVAQKWAEVAAETDDAELILEVSELAGELHGLLYYSKRELADGGTTVFYYNTTLLEWGAENL